MIKKLLQVITLACLLLISGTTHSQVTIGKGEKPAAGALLDLKNLDTPGANGETANKGLMLPRVELSDVSKLYPMLPSGYDAGENAKHNGLVVFNMGTGDVDLCIGIYVWDSQKWNRIPEPCNNSLWSTTNLLFYKSALAAKSITLELSRDNAKVTWVDNNAIPWQLNGFPANDTRKITKTFKFHPTVNNTGTDRTATITATVNSNGKASTETITITQLAREMLFVPPTTKQPALGAEHSLSINAEADWSTAMPATNPGSMVTGITGNVQQAGTKEMKVTLASNNSWVDRTAIFNITSLNPDFEPRTMSITQAFVPPTLTIATPASKIIDFGEVTNAANQKQSITFAVNSDWRFNTDAQYANVVSASTSAANTILGGGVSTVAQNKTVTLTPNGTNTAAGGTPYQTSLTFTTQNTGTQPAKTETITVKRTVPYLYTTPTLTVAAGTTLTRAGHSIGLTTNTNRAWWIRQVSSTTTGNNMAANTYASRSLLVTVPANDTWTQRTGIVLAHSVNGSAFTTAATYTQAPYDLAYSTHTALAGAVGGKVARGGKNNMTVTLRSNNGHPTTNIHLTNNLVATLQFNGLAGIANPTTEALKNRIYTTAIPANDSWTERTFTIHYYTNAWVNTGTTFTQHSYDLNSGQGNLPASIGPEANNGYYINTYSTNGCPNFRVGVATALDGNGQPTAWATNVSGHAGVGNRYFEVPANPSGAARNLYFVFEQTGNKWVNVKTVSQAGQPWIDGGGWWVHSKVVYAGNVGDNWGGTRANQVCANAYGAGWGGILKEEHRQTGSPSWDYWRASAFDAWAQLSVANKQKLDGAPSGVLSGKTVFSLVNHNNSSGSYTSSDVWFYDRVAGNENAVARWSQAAFNATEIYIACGKPK